MTISEAFTIYWPVFAFAIGGIVSVFTVWTKLNSKVQAANEKITEIERGFAKLEGRVDTMQPDLGTIKTDIAVMKNTLEFIKGTLAQSVSGTTNNIGK